MGLTTLPTKADGSIGRVKNELPDSDPSPDLDYYETAASYERLKTALVDVCAEVGLADGSTAGSLVERVTTLEGAPGGEWPVTILTASATLTAVSQIVQVDATAGAVVLALPAASAAAGVRYLIRQIDSSENTITLDPAGSDAVADGGAGVDYLLPESGAPGAWNIHCNGVSDWRRSDYVTPIPAMGAIDGLRLTEQAGDPSATANEGKLYTKDVGGVTHHFVLLSDGTSIRLSGTATAPAALGRAASAGTLASVANADHVHDEGVLVAPTSMSSNTTLTAAMQVLLIDTTSGALNLTLPTPVSSSPRHWLLKKINAGASDITLIRGGSENIEGAGANKKLPQSESLELPSWTLVRDNSGNFWIF